MKKLLGYSKIVFMAITLVITISCDDDENGNIIDPNNGMSNTVADFVINNPEYSSLSTALQRIDMLAILAGNGSFTLFAPDNTAFDTFLNGTSLDAIDDETLLQLISNHLIGATLSSEQFTTNYVKSLAQETATGSLIDLFIDTTNGLQLNGQSNVVMADIQTDNGIVHTVDAVIELPTLQTFTTTNPDLSVLMDALTDEGNTTFTDILGDADADITLFAPTNTAFDTFLNGTAIADVDNEALTQIASNHFVTDTIAISFTLTNSYLNTLATFQNDPSIPLSLYVNTDTGTTLNGTSNVTQGDIVGINGVMHIVDAVIDVPDVTTFILADPTFSSFATSLIEDDSFEFIGTLQTSNDTVPAPFTVFPPTNDAFTNLLTDLNISELNEIPTATLASTIELHIIPGTNIREDLFEVFHGTFLETLGGNSVLIDSMIPAIIDPDNNTNEIIATDIQAANGVLHIVNRVIRDL